MIADWSQSAGAIFRNHGVVPEAPAGDLTAVERAELRRQFREVHAAKIAIGEELREWSGCWLDMPNSGRPDPDLAPMVAAARVAASSLGVFTPAGPDAECRRIMSR